MLCPARRAARMQLHYQTNVPPQYTAAVAGIHNRLTNSEELNIWQTIETPVAGTVSRLQIAVPTNCHKKFY